MFAILVNKHIEALNPKYEATSTLLGGESNLILSRRFLKRKSIVEVKLHANVLSNFQQTLT